MNFSKLFQIATLFFFFLFVSCTKQAQYISETQKEQNAIAQIKKIVGNKGTITVLRDKPSLNLINTNSTFSITDTSRNITLTLVQFKEVYDLLITGKLYDTTVKIKAVFYTNTLYKKFDVIDEGPGPKQSPGMHFVYFPPALLSFYNGNITNPNPSMFSFLSLQYNSDNEGFVYGFPSISMPGLQLFSWKQSSISQITYNRNLGYSSFTINGDANFGISIGGGSGGGGIGWTAQESFTIHVYSDGTISICSILGGIK